MLAIFDMSSANIERYNSDLLKNYSGQYVAYVDDPEFCTELDSPEAILICSSGWSIKKIMHSIEKHHVSVVIISGQRPADFRIVIAANKLNIPIIYKMHGLYVTRVKRNALFYFSNISKVFKTVRYLFDIAFSTGNIRIAIGIFLSFVFGWPRRNWMVSEDLRVDHGLVWSEYWKSWHERCWSMNPRQGWKTTGNPDTTKFATIPTKDKSFCYVYQTLVEDGRISRSTMESFYDKLARIARTQNKIVHVKWHARGDATMREGLERRGFHIHNKFPIGTIYVGHFSSLLGLVPLIGGLVIVFELEGHATPDPIRQCATLITSDIDTLEEGVASTYDVDESKKTNAIYYFGDHYFHNVEELIVSQHTDD
ncbi:hypothetical protein ACFL4I_01565 [Pseudomonadota bacterium]